MGWHCGSLSPWFVEGRQTLTNPSFFHECLFAFWSSGRKYHLLKKNSKSYLTVFEGCVAGLYKKCLTWYSQQSQEGEIILSHTWLVSKLSPEVGWLSQVLWRLWERAVQAPGLCKPRVWALSPYSSFSLVSKFFHQLQWLMGNDTWGNQENTPFSTKNNCHKISCLLNSVKGELCGRGS